jgi:hypothetical protein
MEIVEADIGLPVLAEALNAECFCIGLDAGALRNALETELGHPGLADLLRHRCPYLFSARPVFVDRRSLRRMAEVIRAVESVVALPAYRARVLSKAPSSARLSPSGARSVFFGYDFHLAGDELGLIEINTNAGGAMLNAVLARAQRACCPAIEGMVPGAASARAFEASLVQMFRDEWHAVDRGRPLRRIAIVDQAPADQYLYPEFVLFQHLFERHGIHAVVADPAELHWRDGALWHEAGVVDLVYNRLTDFSLAAPASSAILAAYAHGAAVVTPHPQAHALYADKRNLALLTDAHRLSEWGVPPDVQTARHSAHRASHRRQRGTPVARSAAPLLQAGSRLRQPCRLPRRQDHEARVGRRSRRRLRRAGPDGARQACTRCGRAERGPQVRSAGLRL